MKLRSHLTVLALVTLFPLALFSTISVALFAGQERAAMKRGAIETARALMSAVDRELERAIAPLNALATSPHLDRDDLRSFYADAGRALRSQTEWLTILLASPDGRQILNLLRPLGEALPPAAERRSFERVVATGKPAVGDVVIAPVKGQHDFAVRVPVLRQGRLKYVLSAVVRPKAMADVLAEQKLPVDWIGSIIDGGHVHVARTRAPEQFVGRKASPDLVSAVSTSAEGWIWAHTLENLPVYAAYSRSATSGWTVALEIPAPIVEAPQRRSLMALAGGGALCVVVGVALAGVVARRITTPIAALARAAAALSRREVPLPLPPSSVRELDQLGQALEESAVLLRREVDARARLLDREQAARKEAEAANRAKDEFLAMLGHELRNPLGAIITGVHLLDRIGEREARAVRAREAIARQVEHLARLVDDLLDIARVTAGKILLERRPVDLADVASRCVNTLSAAARTQRHAVTLAAEPAWVYADGTRLEQIVNNLVMNAVKYTPPGGAIRVTVKPEGETAVLGVEDTGIGIPAEMLPRVFDLFIQGERTLDRSQGGLGVGLSLVRRLVELHGGTASVASEGLGRGSLFTIRFPLIGAPSDASTAPPPPAAGARRRVVIVEDNDDARETLRLLLEVAGHEVYAADGGPEAVEMLRSLRPDIAFVDIGLPGFDGYEVARSVRASAEGRDMLLVALTGYGQPEDRRRAAAAGFDVHVVKPLDHDRLVELLSTPGRRGAGAAP
jgi:signal transduction histidine kinase/ActR/RegA family two-component response regulator